MPPPPIVVEALKWVGTKEDPPNSDRNPFSAALGRPPEFWCMDAVAYWAKKSGTVLPDYSASTQQCATAFQKIGRLVQGAAGAQSGDIVFFAFGSRRPKGQGLASIEHVGVCVGNQNGKITTVDGNTGSRSQTNGGAVLVVPRSWGAVAYYGRPSGQGPVQNLSGTPSGGRSPANDLERFVLATLPAALTLSQKTGIDASFFITHWSVETGNGTSTGFQRRKNLGNITVGSGATVPGGWDGTKDAKNSYGLVFRIYKNLDQSATDYFGLLTRSYSSVVAAAKRSAAEGFTALAASPWDAGHYSGEQVAANGKWSGQNAGRVLRARHPAIVKAINEVGGTATPDFGPGVPGFYFGEPTGIVKAVYDRNQLLLTRRKDRPAETDDELIQRVFGRSARELRALVAARR